MNIKLGITFIGIMLVSLLPDLKTTQETNEPFMPDFKGHVYIFDTKELSFYSGGLLSNGEKQIPLRIIQKKEQHPWIQIIDTQYTYWMNLDAPELTYREYIEE